MIALLFQVVAAFPEILIAVDMVVLVTAADHRLKFKIRKNTFQFELIFFRVTVKP